MRRKKKMLPRYNKTFPILLFIATLFMGIGFAATTSVTLDIFGTATTKKKTGITITSVNYISNNNANINNSRIDNIYQNNLESYIELSPTDPTSSITYEITIQNGTTEDYYFKGIEYTIGENTYSNQDIIYTLTGLNENELLQSNQSKTFTITFSYKNGTLSTNNTLKSYLNFSFKKQFTITYNNLNNITSYPTTIFEGETLTLDLTPSNPFNINVYINGELSNNYTYTNKIVTIPNITSNISIQGISDNNYDVPITDEQKDFVTIDGSTNQNITVSDLFDLEINGINGSTKIITRIDVIITYTSSTGSKQSVISTLTHNNSSQQKQMAFEGKTTNGTLTITFDNLNIGIHDVFTITNTNEKITNGNVQIHSEEIKAYFNE